MSYTALYRKWRPATFDEVRGQDAVVQTLKNQIAGGRVGHAYLFCGTRGTGKTSVAKIFARAVNCENPQGANPCNACASCRAIAAGASMNVAEIDAASNNGVENIRDIREQVLYPPTEGHYRVYIIDEVHMLSTGAFNALLKTLEEPPSYVIFLLATTEVQKIPVTVISRCQRFDFRRMTTETIVSQLRYLTEAEGVEAEEKALRHLARAADGAMRDAVSLLDQCITFRDGSRITGETVLEVLGTADMETFSRLFQAVVEGDTQGALTRLDAALMAGAGLGQFVIDFIGYLRNLLIFRATKNPEAILDLSEENISFLEMDAGMADASELARYIRVFSELSNQIRYASGRRVLAEVALIKLTTPQMEPDLDSVLQRLARLEKQVQEGIPAAPAAPAAEASRDEQGGQAAAAGAAESGPERIALPRAEWEDLNRIRQDWPAIRQGLSGPLRAALAETTAEPAGEGCLCIAFTNRLNCDIISRPASLAEIEAAVGARLNKEIHLKTRMKEQGGGPDPVYVTDEELQAAIHMEVMFE